MKFLGSRIIGKNLSLRKNTGKNQKNARVFIRFYWLPSLATKRRCLRRISAHFEILRKERLVGFLFLVPRDDFFRVLWGEARGGGISPLASL